MRKQVKGYVPVLKYVKINIIYFGWIEGKHYCLITEKTGHKYWPRMFSEMSKCHIFLSNFYDF